MSEQSMVPETTPADKAELDRLTQVAWLIQTACDIAMGRLAPDPTESGHRTVGARRELNSKGNGPEWYRMVYRAGAWRYVSDDRLPRGTFLASDRRATVWGDVYSGEIMARHDRGQGIDRVYIVRPFGVDDQRLIVCAFVKQRDDNLRVKLPTGDEVTVSNPRK